MKKINGLALIVAALTAASAESAPVYGMGTWEATLQARDLDGNNSNGPEAFYDTALNVSWLAYGTTTESDWASAKAWAEQPRYGLAGWRLPTMLDTGLPGCDNAFFGTDCGYNVQTMDVNTGQVYSEIAYLFYVGLGNKAYADALGFEQPNWGLKNTGQFLNLQDGAYWSGVEYAPDAVSKWFFSTSVGGQGHSGATDTLFALAVLDGDAAAQVPEPAPFALVLTGLAGISLARRQRNRAQASSDSR